MRGATDTTAGGRRARERREERPKPTGEALGGIVWGATTGALYLIALFWLEPEKAGIVAPLSVAVSVWVYVTVPLGFGKGVGVARQALGFAYLMAGVALIVGVVGFVAIPMLP